MIVTLVTMIVNSVIMIVTSVNRIVILINRIVTLVKRIVNLGTTMVNFPTVNAINFIEFIPIISLNFFVERYKNIIRIKLKQKSKIYQHKINIIGCELYNSTKLSKTI